MEVLPGGGFRMPHQKYETPPDPAPATGPPIAAAPHEFYFFRSPTTPNADVETSPAPPHFTFLPLNNDSDPGTAWYRNRGFGGVPASANAIAGLPLTTVGVGDAAREEEYYNSCAVCQERYEAGDTLRTMPCSHGFHEACIVDWLSISRLCPLCRFTLPTEAEEENAARLG